MKKFNFLFAGLLMFATAASASVDKTVMEIVPEETNLIKPFEAAPEFVQDELVCLALNVYHEARGSTLLDQLSTAFVALNRLSVQYRGARTVCDVVWQRKQFSWTHDGRSDFPHDEKAWKNSQFVAFMAYRSDDLAIDDPTRGSTHYVRHDIFHKVGWTRAATSAVRIGSHIYMRKD